MATHMEQDHSAAPVLVNRADGVLHLTLNRPDRLNALDAESVERCRDALISVEDDHSVGAVVISGAGRAFCAGRDVETLHDVPDRRPMNPADRAAARRHEHDRLVNGFSVVTLLRALRVPCVAALHGAVAGAGLGIALACDLRVVATNTTLVSAYGRIWLLPRVLGDSVAKKMLLTGHRPSVATLDTLGFASAVVAPEDVTEEALRQAATLAAGPRIAHRHMKALMHEDGLLEHLVKEAEATMECQESDAHRTALERFIG